MQAHFLLGPAGSGKTFRCLAEIRAALRAAPEGPPLVLLVPKQATFQLERQLLAEGALPGYTRLNILSFERLAELVLAKLRAAPPRLLAEEGRIMVLRALLLRHADQLKLFRQSAVRSGLARQLSQLLGELQQHQFTPAKLRALSARSDLRPELRDKLHDLALLLDAYAQELARHGLQDANRLLDAATDALHSPSAIGHRPLAISGLWLDGFAEMTPQELDLLAAVLPHCNRATLAFCLESEPGAETSWLSIWSAVGKTLQRCRQRLTGLADCQLETEWLKRQPQSSRFAEKSALARLEQNWSSPGRADPKTSEVRNPQPEISVVVCANADAEAAFAAREILRFARAGGRFRDAAVLVRNLDACHKPLARAFRRYGLPFFLDRRESVSHHPLAELTRSALRTIAFDWLPEDWFAALKAGFSAADETEIDRLENESLARGWRGAKWREPVQISDHPGRGDLLERLRKKILPPFENLAGQLARCQHQPTGAQLAAALRQLWDELHVARTLANWSLASPGPASLATRPAAQHQAVWEQMNVWLDNVALAFPDEPRPLRDWLPILEEGLANLSVGVIPPALDQVLIGAIDRARNPDLKWAFVLGLNETVFPAAPAAPAILTDADRDELGRRGAAPGPDLRERLARERYLGYIACTRASEKLVLACSRQDADGKALNPSPFIAHLQRIFPGLEVEELGGEVKTDQAQHACELVVPLVQAPNWDALLALPALAGWVSNLRVLREPDPAESLSPPRAERIFGPVLRTSVSRLEEFAQCPFRFFVHSGLRAEERKVFELDAREQGSFQHDVLKQFHEELMAGGKRWRDLTPSAARERVGRLAAGLADHYRDGLLRDTAQTRFTARTLGESLQDFVEVIVTWLRGQNEFDPVAAEIDFGGEGARVPAWEMDLGGGHRLALRGRIDRVDLYRGPSGGPALAVVMDYKSGGKKLDPLLVEHGVQLQLLAYLNVLRHWPDPRAVFGVARLVPAGVFYVNLRGQYEGGGTRDEALSDPAAARRRAYRHTGRFAAEALPHLDRPGVADQFNYRRNQDGSLRKGSIEALPRQEFEALLDGVETQLREMGRRIFSGAAQVDPYRKGRETPCEFCDYRAACRIDPWTHRYRVLREMAGAADDASAA